MITVTRIGKGLVLAKLKVFVDDQALGILKYNDSKSFDVAPGSHSIYLKMDWVKSNVVEFTSTAGQDLNFKCIIDRRTVNSWEEFWQFMKRPRYNREVIIKQVQ